MRFIIFCINAMQNFSANHSFAPAQRKCRPRYIAVMHCFAAPCTTVRHNLTSLSGVVGINLHQCISLVHNYNVE
jgi:hypothetical protein